MKTTTDKFVKEIGALSLASEMLLKKSQPMDTDRKVATSYHPSQSQQQIGEFPNTQMV